MESKKYRILKEGFAWFDISEASDTDHRTGNQLVTKKGDPMLKLKISVVDKEGMEETIYDYLFTSNMGKVLQLQACLGVGALFSEGRWNKFLLQYKSGICTVKTQFAEAGSQWDDRSVIGSYMSKDAMRMLSNAMDDKPKAQEREVGKAYEPVSSHKQDDLGDDDIPF